MSQEMNEVQSPGLSGLISQTAYEPYVVNEEAHVEPGTDSPRTVEGNEGLSPAVTNTPQTPPDPALTQPPAGNEPAAPQVVQLDPAEYARMQETITNQTRFIEAARQQEAVRQEQEFQRSLQDMEPEQREIAIRDRQLQFYRQQNQQLQQTVRQSKAESQEAAKRQLTFHVAAEHDIPEFFADALMAARSIEEMDAMAQRIKSGMSNYSPQPAQQQVAPATPPVQQPAEETVNPFAAGGEGGGSNTMKEIEPGSGDLMGLIQRSSYQVISGF